MPDWDLTLSLSLSPRVIEPPTSASFSPSTPRGRHEFRVPRFQERFFVPFRGFFLQTFKGSMDERNSYFVFFFLIGELF